MDLQTQIVWNPLENYLKA